MRTTYKGTEGSEPNVWTIFGRTHLKFETDGLALNLLLLRDVASIVFIKQSLEPAGGIAQSGRMKLPGPAVARNDENISIFEMGESFFIRSR